MPYGITGMASKNSGTSMAGGNQLVLNNGMRQEIIKLIIGVGLGSTDGGGNGKLGAGTYKTGHTGIETNGAHRHGRTISGANDGVTVNQTQYTALQLSRRKWKTPTRH